MELNLTRPELLDKFQQQHLAILVYTGQLGEQQYVYSQEGKWTAGQQISHLFLCLQTISGALASKTMIEGKFGLRTRKKMDYNEVIHTYKAGLQNGGKALERFLPPPVTIEEKSLTEDSLRGILALLQLQHYTEDELDTYMLPHPFLGLLTIREFFYLMTFHASHHQEQIEKNL